MGQSAEQLYGKLNPKYLDAVAEALRVARKSNMKQKHGVVIIDKYGNVLSRGWNRWLTIHGGQSRQSIHAEKHAITRLHPKYDITELIMISVRVTPGGNIGLAKPCTSCQALIDRVGLKEIWHS